MDDIVDLKAFERLPAREQLKLLEKLVDLSDCGHSTSYDALVEALYGCAADLAEEEGWEGDDIAARYMADSAYTPRVAWGMGR